MNNPQVTGCRWRDGEQQRGLTVTDRDLFVAYFNNFSGGQRTWKQIKMRVLIRDCNNDHQDYSMTREGESWAIENFPCNYWITYNGGQELYRHGNTVSIENMYFFRSHEHRRGNNSARDQVMNTFLRLNGTDHALIHIRDWFHSVPEWMANVGRQPTLTL